MKYAERLAKERAIIARIVDHANEHPDELVVTKSPDEMDRMARVNATIKPRKRGRK
jgi:hypothetical protein